MDFVPFNCPTHPGLNRLRSQINATAVKHNVPPCALAAVVMRETGGQNIFQEDMPLGPGCGVGVCQITSGVVWLDPKKPTYQGYDLTNTQENLEVAARFFLAPAIAECLALREQYAMQMNTINPQILYFAFAAYNAGFGAVKQAIQSGRGVDAITTNSYASGTLDYYNKFIAESHNRQ